MPRTTLSSQGFGTTMRTLTVNDRDIVVVLPRWLGYALIAVELFSCGVYLLITYVPHP